MKNIAINAIKFTEDISSMALNTKTTVKMEERSLLDVFAVCLKEIEECYKNGKKIIFIGNGGSAAIANHQATDYWKNGGIKSVSFSDSSMLTCLSNDFGYEHVFAKPIEGFADKGDIVFAISSSGKSENIPNGVKMALDKGCKVVTFSGFLHDNPLRKLGDVNFYVSSNSYGTVEVVHHLLIHSILEARLKGAEKI